VCTAQLPPYEYTAVQAVLGIVHMLLCHLELVWIPAWARRRNGDRKLSFAPGPELM